MRRPALTAVKLLTLVVSKVYQWGIQPIERGSLARQHVAARVGHCGPARFVHLRNRAVRPLRGSHLMSTVLLTMDAASKSSSVAKAMMIFPAPRPPTPATPS